MQNFTPGRQGKKSSFQPMSEINMTPFVDVVLVLLIIFMVTAPLMTVGVEVELPQTNAESLSDPIEPLVVSINAKGELYLQNESVPVTELESRLALVSKQNKSVQIYVRGDQSLSYGQIMKLMGLISRAGYEKVALVTEVLPNQRR